MPPRSTKTTDANIILRDGNTSVWQPPSGYEAKPDFTGTIQIGQTVTP